MNRPRYVSGPVPHMVPQRERAHRGHALREFRWWWRCPECRRVSMASERAMRGEATLTCMTCEWTGTDEVLTETRLQATKDRTRPYHARSA